MANSHLDVFLGEGTSAQQVANFSGFWQVSGVRFIIGCLSSASDRTPWCTVPPIAIQLNCERPNSAGLQHHTLGTTSWFSSSTFQVWCDWYITGDSKSFSGLI
eukprot:5415190-Amphidinium_carterae.1